MDRVRLTLLVPFLTSLIVLLPPAAGAQPTASAVYVDPAGRFTVPIPTNWTATSANGYGLLTDPDGVIRVYVLAVDADDVEQGVAAAWQVVDPTFALAVREVTRPPATGGVEQTVTVTYDTPANRTVLGAGDLYQGVVYVVLVDAPTDAFVRRASQVAIIGSGYAIAALEKTDLRGVMPRPVTPDVIAALEDYITSIMLRHQVPGAAVAVVQNGQVVYTNGFGVRELGTSDPVTPDTLMMIGSVGKTMTTMMMATVVDEGRMRWDERVVDILPTFAVADPALTERFTVRDLVCACTGVPRRDLELIFNAGRLTAEAIVESLQTFQVFTEFGAAFQYSNQLVATGGYVATLAAGGHYGNLLAEYQAEMQRRVFDPIGMTSTTFSFDRVRATPDHAIPHGQNIRGEYVPIPLSFEELLTPVAPAGASWSNARDMARYLITELNVGVSPDGRRVVSVQNLRATWEPQVSVTAEASYGLGWLVDRYKGVPMFHHNGGTLGFTADLAFLPDADVGIVVLTNAQGSNAFNEAVRFRLLELIYDQPAEHEAHARFAVEELWRAIDDALARLQPLDVMAVAPYLGVFRNDALGEIGVALRGGRLVLDVGEFATELRPSIDARGELRYVAVEPPLTGFALQFTTNTETGAPIIVIDLPPDVYTFSATSDEQRGGSSERSARRSLP